VTWVDKKFIHTAAKRQATVIRAIILRNIRTRFFGHGLGFLIALGWPLAHMLITILMFSYGGRLSPYGESTAQFIAIGSVQFMTFSYLSRFMMMSVVNTRPLLSFPAIKVLDILIASSILEFLASCTVAILIILIAIMTDTPFVPRDILEAAFAFVSSVLLGVGFGILNGVISLAFPMWLTLYTLIIILLWITSGILFVPAIFPEYIRMIVSYHPVLQSIEWMRYAYYEGYSDIILDRSYAIKVGVGAIFLGLLLERSIRGHLLAYK
jgi:capsular polysaccharide transport system permease protein